MRQMNRELPPQSPAATQLVRSERYRASLLLLMMVIVIVMMMLMMVIVMMMMMMVLAWSGLERDARFQF